MNSNFLSYRKKVTCLFVGILLLFFSVKAQNQLISSTEMTSLEDLVVHSPDSALLLLRRIQGRFEKERDVHALGICYQHLGRIFYYQGAYVQALEYGYKADRIFRKENNLTDMAVNLNNIGQVYYHTKLKDKCLPLYNEALNIFKETLNYKGIARSYGLIGQTLEKRGDYATDFKYQFLALEAYKKTSDSSGIAKIYENIGSIYEDKLELGKALKYYNLALEINKSVNNVMAQSEIINNIGDFYRKTGDLKKAMIYTKQALNLASKVKDKHQVLRASQDLVKLFESMDNIDSAYYYTKVANGAFRDIFKNRTVKQLNLLQMLFEVEKKDNEINHLESERSFNQLLYGGIILICFLLIVLAYITISRQRLRNKKDQLIHEAQKSIMEAELKNKLLQENKLQEELEQKSKELTGYTLRVIQKNQLLEELKNRLAAIIKDGKKDQQTELTRLIGLINIGNNHDKNWEDFRVIFEKVHIGFFTNLNKYSNSLTSSDLRLLALLKMNLDSADIATMLGISQNSLRTTRYRLKKKLKLSDEESLFNFVQQF